MGNFKAYLDLLTKTYDEAVELLLQKYGFAQGDYFRESSYKRFMNGEIKSIAKGKYSRTSEGLYCHHIDENKALNISNLIFIKNYKIPYEYQRKDRLVYCNLLEHAILHVLISKETAHKFGYPGYSVYLKPIIEEWYIDGKIPRPAWMRNCYHKAFITPEEAVDLLKEMQEILGGNYFNTPYEYHEEKRRMKEKIKAFKARERRWTEEDEAREKREKEREEQIKEEKTEEFYRVYPKFKDMNICFDSSRQKVIAMLFEVKYSDIYKSKKTLDSAMKSRLKDELLKELYLAVCNVENAK